MASSLIHCSHPMDYLVKTQSPSGQFTCSRCHCWGSGLHYRCQACGFVMHECCLEFPETISFFAHPWHNLHLHPADSSNPRQCDICNELVEGFSYSCISCGFVVHPHCTKAKQIVRSNIHAGHDLRLVPTNSVCSACNRSDGTWFYRCGMCNVSLHKKCLDGSIVPNHVSLYCGQSNSQQMMHGQAYNSNSPIVPNHVSPCFGHNMYSTPQMMMYGQAYNVPVYNTSNSHGHGKLNVISNILTNLATETISQVAGNLISETLDNIFS